MRLRFVVGVALLMSAIAPRAGAQGSQRPPVDVRAENVEIDARTRELDLRGDVRVDSPPFHLRSDALRVQRSARGVEVDGEGRLAFCPCLGAPLAVRFDHAVVAPPGDLLLTHPQLEVYGLPVLWLPYFWLRSPGRFGLLPPDLAYRGGDGLYLGEGVHLPWTKGDEDHALDLRAGAYFIGGAVVDARLSTPASLTRVRWDHLRGDGLTLDARGAVADARDPQTGIVVWDVDAIRGARGVAATTELDLAARPYDRASAETAWRSGGWTFATGVRATSPRGADLLDLGAVGPIAMARRGEAIGGIGAYDATVEGGALRDAAQSISFARGELGLLLAERLGPFGVGMRARAAGSVAAAGEREGGDGAAALRLRAALPLVRAYDSSDVNDPWLHRIEPELAAALLASRGSDVLGALPGRGAAAVHGESWVSEVSVINALGRWGKRVGSEASTSLGFIGPVRAPGDAQLASRWRAAASGTYLGFGAETGRVWTGADRGGALALRARIGAQHEVNVGLTLAERDRVDPIVARALTDAPLEPSAGFLSAAGWTGGARIAIPWSAYVVTRAGADADLTTGDLVAARGSFELRDKCGCIVLRGTGAHRIGRDGLDVWITIDLAPPPP